MRGVDALLVTAGTLTSLFAGLMFGFLVAVNPGLGRLSDRGYLSAMQSINVAIQNPGFMLVFAGPIVLLPWAAVQRSWDPLLLIASILFIVGGIGVTAGLNVPLNQRLAGIDLNAKADAELATIRAWFEKPWNRWHLIRTLAAIVATVLVFCAAL